MKQKIRKVPVHSLWVGVTLDECLEYCDLGNPFFLSSGCQTDKLPDVVSELVKLCWLKFFLALLKY